MKKILFLTISAFVILLSFTCDIQKLPPVSKKPVIAHRGIYINDFLNDGILGNQVKEDSLLNWVSINGFNHLYLYNTHQILQQNNLKTQFSNFIQKAKNQVKPVKVTAVTGGLASINNLKTYIDDTYEEPYATVSEIEFWNTGGSFDYFLDWLAVVNDILVNPPVVQKNAYLEKHFYIGKIKDKAGVYDSLEVAKKLVLEHNRIFLTNYHTDAFEMSTSTSSNAIRAKLQLLADAAAIVNKDVHIVILFNVRSDSPAPNIFSYFDENGQNHKFNHAYESFKTDFDAAIFNHKDKLKLEGYGIYRYSDAKVARPL